jgi:hypothetical protein
MFGGGVALLASSPARGEGLIPTINRSTFPTPNSSRSNGASSTAGPLTITRLPSRHSVSPASRSAPPPAAAGARPVYVGLWHVCKRAAAAGDLSSDKDKAREFFEDNFRPVRIAKLGESTGLLTGYYEPIVDGSRFPSPEFSTPLYRRPRDLVVAGQKTASAVFPNRATLGRLNAGRAPALSLTVAPSRTAY